MRAHASASSISAASSIQKPPMCSLVSVYGPSVTSTVPSGCFRTVFALLAGEIPQANFRTPAAINSRLSAVYLLDHRFGYGGRVEVVREVAGNQILRRVVSCKGLRVDCPAFTISSNGPAGIRQGVQKIRPVYRSFL